MSDLFQRKQVAIRALAASKRDHTGWTDVCTGLDDLPDDMVRAHIDELDMELDVWPVQLRAAPLSWVKRLRIEGREPRLQLCRVLGLGRTTNRDELWRALDAPDVDRIDVLGVEYCGLDEGAMPELARKVARMGVRQLWLTGNRVGIGIEHVLRLSCEGILSSLEAESCGLGKDVLETLVGGGAAIGLRELGLAVNYLKPRDVEHLVLMPGLDGVRRLNLSGNKFLAPGVRALVPQAPLYGLRELSLDDTQCGDGGAAILAGSTAFARLESLSLMGCLMGDLGAAALAATTSQAALLDLNLESNGITAAGVRSLLVSTQLAALVRLNLMYNQIEDDIVDVLGTCPQVSRLASLTLDDTYLSEEARVALRSLPLRAGLLDLHLVHGGA